MNSPHSNHYSIIGEYKDLPSLLQDQLSHLDPYFNGDAHFQKSFSKYLKRLGHSHDYSKREIKILARMFLLESISAPEIIDLMGHGKNKIQSSDLICYDHHHHWIRLKDKIATGRHVRVVTGSLEDSLPVVMKWYRSSRKDTRYEIEVYQKLKYLGCTLPWFSGKFKFWDEPVLVLERLESLDSKDHFQDVGRAILKQLETVHEICIHNDIKPGNIMRKTVKGRSKYYLIDYGGVTLERLEYGFRRKIWSPKWTCQTSGERDQVTTPWHDFIELGFTMKAIENWRTGDWFTQSGFQGTLARYMDQVHRLDPKRITLKDYRTLRKTLKHESLSGFSF